VSVEIATYQDSPGAEVDSMDGQEVEEFCARPREELLDTSTPFS
jgi:hypothetical protein